MSELAPARSGAPTEARPTKSKTILRAWAPLGVSLCVALVACGQQPQKIEVQPTPTQVSAAATPTSLVPEYTSKKKLTPAEKKAAEDALVVLDGYFGAANQAYQSGGREVAGLERFSSQAQLKTLRAELAEWRKSDVHLVGALQLEQRLVTLVGKSKSTGAIATVRVEACVPFGKTKKVTSSGSAAKSWGTKTMRMSFILISADGRWVVNEMGNEAGKC